jgi:16S rRNA G966 N2-methylase RsmD
MLALTFFNTVLIPDSDKIKNVPVGDVNAVVLLADAFEFFKLIPAQPFELILIDPPQGDNNASWDLEAWGPQQLDKLLTQLPHTTKLKEHTIMMISNWQNSNAYLEQLQSTGYVHQFKFIWQFNLTPTGDNINNLPLNNFKEILIASNAEKVSSVFKYGSRLPPKQLSAIIRAALPKGEEMIKSTDDQEVLNPSQRSMMMYYHFFSILLSPGTHVLDICSGTGCAGVVATILGHSVTCVEQELRQWRGIAQNILHHADVDPSMVKEAYEEFLKEDTDRIHRLEEP